MNNIENKTANAIKRLEKNKHKVEPVNSTSLLLSMSQSVDLKGKKVSIITYFGGGQGLLIDGKEYHLQISFYELRPNTEIEKTVTGLNMETCNYGFGEITEEEEDKIYS